MALESEKKHRRIWRIQSRMCSIAFAVMLTFTGLGAALDAHSVSNSKAAAQVAEHRVAFWEIIAGSQSAHSVSSSNKLASTLHVLLTDHPDDIAKFKAGANQFGNVSDELGFNPFDNTGLPCSECGGLNPVMINNLNLIKDGQTSVVVSGEDITPNNTMVNFTPFDLSNGIWFGGWYLIYTTGALIFAIRKDSKDNEYDPALLDWGNDGGSTTDYYRKLSESLSPAYFLFVLPLKHKFGKNRDKMLRNMGLAESTKELHAALDHLNELQVPRDQELAAQLLSRKQQIVALLASVDEQADIYSSSHGGFSSAQATKDTLDKIDHVINMNAPAIEARQKALTEMEDK